MGFLKGHFSERSLWNPAGYLTRKENDKTRNETSRPLDLRPATPWNSVQNTDPPHSFIQWQTWHYVQHAPSELSQPEVQMIFLSLLFHGVEQCGSQTHRDPSRPSVRGALFNFPVETMKTEINFLASIIHRTRNRFCSSFNELGVGLHENLTVAQIVNKCRLFYATRKFITAFTVVCQWSLFWARWIHSTF
jgi:hypothetical protein